ncbi:hypothetical protein LTR02_017324 [Friedmanniomyces endolithicus]|uniref:Cytochrome P450 n=1 Tax=Rachicladosporium monterosium TaxID=1507873 RepID=A0ABR0LEF4_9PEZI|nr:hypothetical protein LTR94_020293 [Friedmanniomyces endolithicus]KAK0785126.1 hypothetical protein LTR75_013619 [Friedmanniomyces endolithicus]KAK0887338.1 hypothetical protein LTR02_017324 [Friedmanniomyces endolithicus]KAK5147598.1 hypothetical protein LTR32_000973 [Rachicladosporium monterosium]
MSSLVTYEAFVDTCTALFRKHLAERAGDGTEMDLAWWMNCYATDTVAMISSSQRLGDLDAGEDVGDLAKTLHGGLAYVSLVGIFAEWHLPLMNLMAHLRALGLTKGSPRMIVNDFVLRVMGERRQHRAAREKVHADLATAAADETTPRDMLDKFLDFHENAPDHFTDTDISVGLSANVVAGADTTAASLSAVLYYLLKNPRTFLRLRADLDAGTAAGTLSSPVTFKQAQDLPYLQAVVQEALRLHPAVGLPLERVVPPPGAELCGRWFPPYTIVGVNAWVLHYDTAVFGVDAAEFRPERWLEVDKERAVQPLVASIVAVTGYTNWVIGLSISQIVKVRLLSVAHLTGAGNVVALREADVLDVGKHHGNEYFTKRKD